MEPLLERLKGGLLMGKINFYKQLSQPDVGNFYKKLSQSNVARVAIAMALFFKFVTASLVIYGMSLIFKDIV